MTYAKRTRVVVAPNVGGGMGGEAIKSYQYFRHLRDCGVPVLLIAHARSRRLGGLPAGSKDIIFIEDGPLQAALWHSRILAGALNTVFHIAASREIRRRFRPDDCIIHYLCPISPVEPRFPPKGYDYLLGPLNENVGWPPSFRFQSKALLASFRRVLTTAAHMTLGKLSGEKRGAIAVLVSGGAETETAVRRAGARPERVRTVVDSGVSDLFFSPRQTHVGENGRFVAIGRFVPYKGFDLILEALAKTPETVTLDIFGDGPEKERLEMQRQTLGLEGRVNLLGWRDNADLAARMGTYRGLVFPTLAEANGIVMQEAMAAGLPVVTIRWGGPSRLAKDDAVAFVEVGSRESIVDGLAREITSLATDGARAERIAAAARRGAERDFRWEAVAAAWAATDPLIERSPATDTPAGHGVLEGD